MGLTSKPSGRQVLWLVWISLFAWPPIYSLFIHAYLSDTLGSPQPSTADLQQLLGARRYTLHVPAECDGWSLALESVVDGVAKRGGAASVPGDSEVTLLVRRTRDTKKIEYCWFTQNRISRGLIDDPIIRAGTTADRSQGLVQPGDWLFRGGRSSLQLTPDVGADFEVRLTLRPPGSNEDA